MKKRLLSILLCLMMALSLIPVTVFAGDSTPATYSISAISSNDAKGTVTGGGVYREGDKVTIKAIPAEGYVFDYWTSYGVIHNGTAAEFSFTVGPDTTNNFTAWFKEITPITKMELAVAAPVAGKKPSDCITVPGFTTDPANAAVLDETRLCWYTPDGNYFNGVFQEGETYEYYMEFSPKSGYRFDFDGDDYLGDVTVTGGTVRYTEWAGIGDAGVKLACAVLVKCGPDTRTPVTNIALTIDAPAAGKTAAESKLAPAITTTPVNGAALTEEYSWHLADGNYFSGIFKANETYLYELCIKCEDGYAFPNDGDEYTGTALVNGEEPYYCEVSSNGEYMYVGILVKCGPDTRTPVTNIALTIDAPEAGKTAAESMFVPGITTTPADSAEFEAADTHWYNRSGSGQFIGTFEAGKEYIYEVCLKCKDGYYFPGSGGGYEGTVSVNGAEAYYVETNNAGEGNLSTYVYIGIVLTTKGTSTAMRGDVNGDGRISVADYTLVLAHVKGTKLITDAAKLKAADVNGDGKVSVADYTLILAHVKGTKLLA